MSLTQIWHKFKPQALEEHEELMEFDESGEVKKSSYLKPFFLTFTVVLISTLSFGIGRLSVEENKPIEINYSDEISSYTPPEPVQSRSQTASAIYGTSKFEGGATVFASSKGKKYYFAHCSGIKRISEANKISFSSAEEAEQAGYTLALNCSSR